MSTVKKILLILLVLLISIQFFQPARNKGQVGEADMVQQLKVPAEVEAVFKKSCYDCHSNNTRYPWYTYVQPVGWLLAEHVKDGKADLNFNEFGTYPARRRLSKLRSIESSVRDGSMPLPSYTWMHADAKLSAAEKELIMAWASKTRDSLSNRK